MVIPRMEVVITVPTPRRRELTRALKIKGIREKIVEIRQGEDPLIGGEGIVEEADQGIDQKKTKEGPDRCIAKKAAHFDLGPKARLTHREG